MDEQVPLGTNESMEEAVLRLNEDARESEAIQGAIAEDVLVEPGVEERVDAGGLGAGVDQAHGAVDEQRREVAQQELRRAHPRAERCPARRSPAAIRASIRVSSAQTCLLTVRSP